MSSSSKGKKGEKKQLALSALTLLAFLFFLNVLQSCLKEQSENETTTAVMMMAVQPPAEIARVDVQEENNGRMKRDTEQTKNGRRLLQAVDNSRRRKFIANYKETDGNWVQGLTKLSDDEIRNQRLKTDSFELFWKNQNNDKSNETNDTPVVRRTSNKINRLIASPILADLKEPKKLASNHPDVKSIEFETKRPIASKVVDFNDFHESEKPHWEEFIGDLGTVNVYQEHNGILNTPRNRRSEAMSTTSSTGDEEFNSIEETSQELQVATPVTPDRSTTTERSYPVYTRPNEKYANHRYTMEAMIPTTPLPQLAPQRNRYRQRYPNYGYYPTRSRYPYQYSPYRRTDYGEYYPMSVVGQYQAPGEEDLGSNLMKFIWTMMSAFAKPIARLVPSFAKVGTPNEPQCYDLLVCEAHRAGALMGPTAEVIASSISTFVSWVSPEIDRQSVADAVLSGKSNSCQQQINDCDARSGGKSAMTMVAQVMELKLRRRRGSLGGFPMSRH